MKLLLQIQSEYPSLSKGNRKIADFLTGNPDDFLNMSALDIGEHSGTSSATVIRFARQMGYSSLEDLKINIAKQLSGTQTTEALDPIICKEDSLPELSAKLSQMIIGTIELCTHQLDPQSLIKALGYMKKAKCIYLYGIGSSGNVAYDLYHKLNRSNIRAMYEADSHMGIEFAAHMHMRDVAIVFSYSGCTKEVLLAARQAHANGAKVIAVTRNRPSPLAAIADVILPLPDNEHLIRIGAIASKYSTMWIADLLFLGMIQEDFEQIQAVFLRTAESVLELKEREYKSVGRNTATRSHNRTEKP